MQNDQQHEARCNNCGKCCYQKVIIGRYVYITPFPCEYLDTNTNLCTVYDRRHELNPKCLSVKAGLKVNAFPVDCPYVAEMAPRHYRPAREDYDWSEDWRHFDKWADEMEVPGEVRERVRQRGPGKPPMYVDAQVRIAQLAAAGKPQ